MIELAGFRGFTAPASLELRRIHPFDALGVGFRGFTAPASLEQTSIVLPPVDGSGFRGFTAPASLEPRRDARRQAPRHPRFPGLYRPGLIGAARFPLPGASATGVSGALPPRPHWSKGDRIDSGEAELVSGALPPRPHWSMHTPAHRSPAFPGGFRGFTAPASLEPVIALGVVHRDEDGFRGFTAPASLEHNPIPTRLRPQRRFPGLYRPGLIGALWRRRAGVVEAAGFRGFTAPASLEPGSQEH